MDSVEELLACHLGNFNVTETRLKRHSFIDEQSWHCLYLTTAVQKV